MQEVLMKRGHQVETLDGKRSGTVVAIFTAPDGERCVVVDVDGALRIFPLDELRVLATASAGGDAWTDQATTSAIRAIFWPTGLTRCKPISGKIHLHWPPVSSVGMGRGVSRLQRGRRAG